MEGLWIRFNDQSKIFCVTSQEFPLYGRTEWLRKGCDKKRLSDFVFEVGLDIFNECISRHPESRGMIPNQFTVLVSTNGTESWVVQRHSVEKNEIELTVPVGTTTRDILGMPEVLEHQAKIYVEQEAESQRIQAEIEETDARVKAAYEEAARRATALMQGAVFSHIEDGMVILKSPVGQLIKVASSHTVWNYGDDSADWLVITGDSVTAKLIQTDF